MSQSPRLMDDEGGCVGDKLTTWNANVGDSGPNSGIRIPARSKTEGIEYLARATLMRCASSTACCPGGL